MLAGATLTESDRLTEVRKAAKKRVALAGARLAELLKNALK
jgi:hypothetical protein